MCVYIYIYIYTHKYITNIYIYQGGGGRRVKTGHSRISGKGKFHLLSELRLQAHKFIQGVNASTMDPGRFTSDLCQHKFDMFIH